MDSYAYDPLDSSREIRLATLISVENVIRIRLESFDLTNAPEYVALSYVWGSAEETMEIIVNGAAFSIRQNLCYGIQALWNSRNERNRIRDRQNSPPSHVLFWADALCIDQTNVPERTQQVNIMSDIYTAAKTVIVWLGPSDDTSDSAIDFIANPEAVWNCKDRDRDGYIGQAIPMHTSIKEAIIALLERPYWRRMWVVQELCLARDSIVLCGTRVLPWYALSSFVDLLCRASNSRFTTPEARDARQAHGCDIIAAKGNDARKLSLELVILRYGSQECSDVRDKIFGCLGLVDFEGRPPLKADYSISTLELAESVSEHLRSVTAHGLYESVNRIAWRNLGLRYSDRSAEHALSHGVGRSLARREHGKKVLRFAESNFCREFEV